MNKVCYTQKFIVGFKVWCVVIAFVLVFAIYLLRAKQSDRAHFVGNYAVEQCTVFENYTNRGKSTTFHQTLKCPGPVYLRSEDVSESIHAATKIGDSITAYYSKDYPDIWSRDLPTAQWHRGKTEKEWLYFTVVLGIVAVILIGTHLYAQYEKDLLEKAEIVDAEIIKVTVGAANTESTIRVKFSLKGEMREETLTVPNLKMSGYFNNRSTKVAVTKSSCKAIDSFMFVELES